MALYRNISGVQGQAVGLSILQQPPVFTGDSGLDLITADLGGSIDFDISDLQQSADAIRAETIARYDYLLSTPFSDLISAGYFVSENGSIFLWTDAAHTTGTAYLPLQDIQDIENTRGTAGALLLHMKQPAIAKDTAGYGSGGSGTGGSTTQYSDPIPEVQTLPPVIQDDSGTVQFKTPPTATTATTTQPNTAVKQNLLPLVAIAGVLVAAVGGDQVIKRGSRLVFVGGIGALFYLMAKQK